jgi:2-keto-4-pentenoate hydratase/2-oxohepta-3-ene-1,7-dioic acid hydratase in catechol pathway
MRVGRADTGDGANRAVIEHDGAFRALDIPPTSGFDALVAALERAGPEERAAGPPLSDSKLVAPLAPNKIVAVGLNYQDHLHETGMEAPTEPLIFAKFPSSVIGPDEPILIDRGLTERVDWEVELTVVIGQTLRDVPVDRALEGVFGYTVANDVSARDVQFNDGQWVRGKSFDTFCPLGPVIVTADEIPDPQPCGCGRG